jgi:phosphoribosylamine--glycine ligase
MNILLIGSGGREHAFAMQLSKSTHCSKLFIMPGNAGTASCGINVPMDPLNFALVGEFCKDNEISLLVVGPEDPLVKGMRNHFEADAELKKIAFVGPDETGAQMEGSKDWSKGFMAKYQIPTAAYQTFTSDNLQEGITYIQNHSLPIVLKADGLAAGKGVLICEDRKVAEAELNKMILENKFGNAGSKVVIEAFLKGIELSVFVLTDGTHYQILPSAKDYKRIGEGEKGLNTGGMGAISPVPFADDAFIEKVKNKIIEPTIHGLKQEGIHYVGFIFIGLMNVAGEPWVIEYNCRMGDPETEVVLPRIKTDLVTLMLATAQGKLNEIQMELDSKVATTIMLVSGGYPEAFEKNKVMTGVEQVKGSTLYHAGTKLGSNNELLSNGGRVMAVTSLADTLQEALAMSNQNAALVQFENKYYRRDIGFEFVEKA